VEVAPVSGSHRVSIVCSAYSMPASGLKKPTVSALRSNRMRPMTPSTKRCVPLGCYGR